jgi:hypothetical protein
VNQPLEPLPDDWTQALAVVAHPDDLEDGAASAIARADSIGPIGGEAGIDGLALAEAAVLRQTEQLVSAAIVGVDDVSFLHYPDGVVEYGPGLGFAAGLAAGQSPDRSQTATAANVGSSQASFAVSEVITVAEPQTPSPPGDEKARVAGAGLELTVRPAIIDVESGGRFDLRVGRVLKRIGDNSFEMFAYKARFPVRRSASSRAHRFSST